MWKYGYNKEHDVIVIVKTGKYGEVYEIQNLKIALPKAKRSCTYKMTNGCAEYPKELKNIKTIFDWNPTQRI